MLLLLALTGCTSDTGDSGTEVQDSADTSVEEPMVGITVLGPDGPVDARAERRFADADQVTVYSDQTGRLEFPVGGGLVEIHENVDSPALVEVPLVFSKLVAGEYSVTLKPPEACQIPMGGVAGALCAELEALPGAPAGRIFALGYSSWQGIELFTFDPVFRPTADGWELSEPINGVLFLDDPTTVVLPP